MVMEGIWRHNSIGWNYGRSLAFITASTEGYVNVVIEYTSGFNRIIKWAAKLPDIKWHVSIHWFDSVLKRNHLYMSELTLDGKEF